MRINGEKCYLKPLLPSDTKALTELITNNKEFWTIYEPRHIEAYYTEYTQYKKLQESVRLRALNQEHFFGIFEGTSNQLVGQVSVYSIKKLPFLSGFIGYSIDENYSGKGIMTEAVRLVINFSFESLNLNRIEAYVSPKNLASKSVLEKSGFKQEGYLRQLLYINGSWEDHFLYAILKEDYLNKKNQGF